MTAYEFYWLDDTKGYELLGVLPERRRNPARITDKTLLGWADKLFGNKFGTKDFYFVKVMMDDNTGMIFRHVLASFEDVAELLARSQKGSNGIEELMEQTSQSVQVDHMKCIYCGRERSEHEMQKVFYKKHKGICKMCFTSEIEG